MKHRAAVLGVLSLFLLLTTVSFGQFTPGNLVLLRMGDGSASLTSAGTPMFLMEYTTAGSSVQTIALPTTGSGRIVGAGSSTSEGHILRSVDTRYLTFAGYDADAWTTGVATATAATINRIVARVDVLGNVDVTTKLTDAYNGSNIRSVVSLDGTTFYTCGNAGSGQGATAGVRYVSPLGATTTQQLHSTTTNGRVVGVFNNQLYMSSSTTGYYGISSIGTGLPTTSGQTVTILPGFSTASGPSTYGFAMSADGNTIYAADDRATASGGGLQKWTLSGGTWSLAYTLNSGLSAGLRSIAVDWSGTNPVIYAVDATSPTNLVTVTDAGSSSAFTTLTSSITNTAWRGVAFAPNVSLTFSDGSSYNAPAVTLGTNDNPIGRFQLASNLSGGTISSVQVSISGTHTGVTNLHLYYSTSSTFDGSATLLATAADAATVTFSFAAHAVPTGSGEYFFITADLAVDAEGQISASIVDQTKFTLTKAAIAGTISNANLSSATNPLPVELVSFSGAANGFRSILSWSTATETNNYGFEIERCALPSRSWTKVGFVAGHGTSNAPHVYSYTDMAIKAGKYIYRLKQIDNGGKTAYSKAIDVVVGAAAKELVLREAYPNPFNPTTNIQFTLEKSGIVTLKVYNLIGQEVATLFNGYAEAGEIYWEQFDASKMSSGLYYYSLNSDNQHIVKKMMFIK